MKKVIFFILIFPIFSCTYEFPEDLNYYSPGNADFSRFISVGDNFSAGFMDGALYTSGQQNSFPAISQAVTNKWRWRIYTTRYRIKKRI